MGRCVAVANTDCDRYLLPRMRKGKQDFVDDCFLQRTRRKAGRSDRPVCRKALTSAAHLCASSTRVVEGSGHTSLLPEF